MIKTAVLTISDTRTKKNDLSGQAIQKMLEENNFKICAYDIVKDKKTEIKNRLIYYADSLKVNLVLTNGGTGLGPRDITPEATIEIIERLVPGISEYIRAEGMKKTSRSMLSCGVSGVRKSVLIINFPGSPKAVKESLGCILEILPHAVAMIKGGGHSSI